MTVTFQFNKAGGMIRFTHGCAVPLGKLACPGLWVSFNIQYDDNAGRFVVLTAHLVDFMNAGYLENIFFPGGASEEKIRQKKYKHWQYGTGEGVVILPGGCRV
ncbi:MAG: hypothetical protein HQL77_06835 [Magnetococcales bacterium]|nr:hypothetical protein [Magnetococcales bacterium]